MEANKNPQPYQRFVPYEYSVRTNPQGKHVLLPIDDGDDEDEKVTPSKESKVE